MKRRALCLAAAIAALGVIVSAPTASAGTKGTCTDSYSLVSANKWGDAGRAIDKNGDGWICQKPSSHGTFNVIDDHV